MAASADARMRLFDPEVLARASSLAMKARIVVDGLVTGLHRSQVRGRDVEFAEHREYSPGDELRHLDWKVFARSGRYTVKLFEQETNARVQILLDCSRSMLVDTGSGSKLDYARSLAACLAAILLRQGDAVGLVLFDSKVQAQIGAQARVEQLSPICDRLVELTPGPDTQIAKSLERAAASFSRRQVLVILSDLLDDQESVLSSIRHLRHRRHDVTVLQILDPQELRFEFKGGLRMRDLESQQVIEVDADRIRKRYRQEAEEFLENYRKGFRHSGIGHQLVLTETPLVETLVRYLSHRAGGSLEGEAS